MLEIKVDASGIKVMGSGSGLDLLVDLSASINKLYSTFHQKDPRFAKVFKDQFLACATDPDSPMWIASDVGVGMIISMPNGEVPHADHHD